MNAYNKAIAYLIEDAKKYLAEEDLPLYEKELKSSSAASVMKEYASTRSLNEFTSAMDRASAREKRKNANTNKW